MSKVDPQIAAHLEWLGFVRPTGLVVSAPALVRAGAIVDQRDIEGQRLLRSVLVPDADEPRIANFRTFATTVLGWRLSPKAYAGTDNLPIPSELEVALDDDEVLRPDYAVRELEPHGGAPNWQLLVHVLDRDEGFDDVADGARLDLSPHSRLERLLRKTGVTAGLLANDSAIRVLSAPRGESSGWLDFRVADMVQTGGRPICSAMRLLLSEQRLLALPRQQRLAALLSDSRKFQNEVSEKLAEQVLHAMYELLRGFQAAHDASKGELLREPLAERPDDVYRALLTVILRLVFLLYAEERDMLPEDDTFLRYYSIVGLYERLREDAALNPDTMDQRFGAWAQLVSLFRMVHDGANASGVHLPPRHGALFDPDRFKFLEGRSGSGGRQNHERIEPPLLPDGTIYRALEKLLVLDGERISYRALDVEQIGSVYETMMGFRLERATGPSVAIKSQKKQGAPIAVDLDALLSQAGATRAKALQDQTGRKLTDTVKKNVAAASTIDELHASLLPVIDQSATPDLVPRYSMVLQPSEERRRSGSHYTPRELTQPIVKTTLDPILERLRESDGKPPKSEAILDLKVCDPAMGSGAFLVEACRYLGDALIESWHAHDTRPSIPPDEDEVIFARRLVAQRCLYGVDRNPVAVDLAKMSLWLVTLARDHALTFVDHALRHGDSLVGLSRKQLEAFHWDASKPPFLRGLGIRDSLDKFSGLRRRIREADESVSDWERRDTWDEAQFELGRVRLLGDLTIAAFLESEKSKEREARRSSFAQEALSGRAEQYRAWLDELRESDPPFAPFHWEIEFPEVFDRERPGFDACIGNPPFLGGTRISTVLGMTYFEWLTSSFFGCQHLCDLVAYFFRRVFDLLRPTGAFGLVATNTIAQGDTREGGLRAILAGGGQIYCATRRYKWPSSVAVVVSIVHVAKGQLGDSGPVLDGARVSRISAYLAEGVSDASPARLTQTPYFSLGSKIYGQGFLFADDDPECTPLRVRDALLAKNPELAARIRPYIGGEEILTHPRHLYHRYVILVSDIQNERDLDRWPELRDIVREKVKPGRDILGDNPNNTPLKRRWWAFQAHRPELYKRLASMSRVLVTSQVNPRFGFALLPADWIFSQKAVVVCIDGYGGFAVVQSLVHETWSRTFGSTSIELMNYTPSDCLETFPFPEGWETHPGIEAAGNAYYQFRAGLMIRNDEGLTKTYNRYHDPEERDPELQELRELHEAMDRAVLDAYGWTDIDTRCEFLLDYEIDEEEWGDKKKPYRYRWPDDVRDEVLARLLDLNAERSRQEARSGLAAEKKTKKGGAKRATAKPDMGDLFK